MTFNVAVAMAWLALAVAQGIALAAGVDGIEPAYVMGAIVLAGVYAKP
jgi:hypothetical protein